MKKVNYLPGNGPLLVRHTCEKKPQLKKTFFNLLKSMLFLLCVCNPFSTIFAADYYVSSSSGNNANNGTSSASPWQTLSQISARTFVAGDQIFLKCGDTWNETVTLNGNGSSTTPVTLTWYGTGERPYIHGPADNVSSCITISTMSQGWNISNIEIGFAKEGIKIMLDKTIRATYDYYKFENCYIHDCINLNWSSTPTDLLQGHGITFYSVNAVAASTNVTVQNCIFNKNDNSYGYKYNVNVTNCLVNGCTFTKGNLNQVWQVGATNYDIKNCMFDHNTNPGRCDTKFGVTAVMAGYLYGGAGVNEVSGNEFGWQGEMGSSHDGCAYDFECPADGVSFINNYIHDCYGEGMLMMSGMTYNNLLVSNNILAYDLNGSTTHTAEFDIRSTIEYGSGGAISNNQFYLRPGKTNFSNLPAIFTFSGNTNPTTPFAAKPAVVVSNGSGTDKVCTVTCSTPGATIRYTTDGSLPVETSPIVANGGTVTISGYTKAFNAKAFAAGYNPSPTNTTIVVVGGSAPPTSALIAHWNLDETSGNAIDNTGKGHTGTLTGAATWTTSGKINGALSLNSGNEGTGYVTAADASDLDFGSNNFSVACWVYKRAQSSNWTNVWGVNKYNTGATPGTNEWSLSLTTTGSNSIPRFSIESGTTSYGANATTDIFNGWHHVVGVRDGSTLRIYVDGTQQGTASCGTVAVNNAGRSLYIGSSYAASSTQRTNALFDDVRVYNYALSPSEISTLYNMGGSQPVIKAWEFTSNTESWTAGNQITGFGWVTGGYVNGTITGSDPYMYSGTNLGVAITDYKYLKIRMKNSTAGTLAAIYFITNADGTYNEAKSKAFTITANDPGYTEYTVDMTAVAGWTGTLSRLRFDPVNSGQTGTFSVDYIRIQQSASSQMVSSSPGLGDAQTTIAPAPDMKSAFVSTTAIAEIAGGPSFNIFPNPAKDKAIILYNLSGPGDAFIRIFNAQGKTLQTIKLPTEGNKGLNQYSLDLPGLIPGIYIVRYSSGEYVKSVKLLIEN